MLSNPKRLLFVTHAFASAFGLRALFNWRNWAQTTEILQRCGAACTHVQDAVFTSRCVLNQSLVRIFTLYPQKRQLKLESTWLFLYSSAACTEMERGQGQRLVHIELLWYGEHHEASVVSSHFLNWTAGDAVWDKGWTGGTCGGTRGGSGRRWGWHGWGGLGVGAELRVSEAVGYAGPG